MTKFLYFGGFSVLLSRRFPATSVLCVSGQIPYWQIVLYFLLSLGLSFLVCLIFFMCGFRAVKVVKSTFFPSVPLPSHIQEVQIYIKTQEVLQIIYLKGSST